MFLYLTIWHSPGLWNIPPTSLCSGKWHHLIKKKPHLHSIQSQMGCNLHIYIWCMSFSLNVELLHPPTLRKTGKISFISKMQPVETISNFNKLYLSLQTFKGSHMSNVTCYHSLKIENKRTAWYDCKNPKKPIVISTCWIWLYCQSSWCSPGMSVSVALFCLIEFWFSRKW